MRAGMQAFILNGGAEKGVALIGKPLEWDG